MNGTALNFEMRIKKDMDPTKQEVFPGNLQSEYRQELTSIREDNSLSRLWARDVSLWSGQETVISSLQTNLEFLHIPERIPQLVAGALNADLELQAQGLTDRIVIAFGSVFHFCKALSNLRPDTGRLKFIILESCHPAAIREAERQAESSKTLVVLVNKSAYQLEDHSLFLYFQKKLQSEAAGSVAGQFVAAGDSHTFLGSIAAEYQFRYFLGLPSGISAAYCSVIHLAVLLKVFARAELDTIRIACRETKKPDGDPSLAVENPPCEICAFLLATIKTGRPFLCFLASPDLTPFASALCRLVGGSLGRGENGLFPVVNTIPCATGPWEEAASFIVLRNQAAAEREVENCASELRSRGIPFLEITVADPLDLLRHTFCWQVATVLAAARMGLNPFDPVEPRLARTLAGELLNALSPRNDTLQRRPRIQEKQIQLFAEARGRQEISQLNLTEGLVSFFERRRGDAYFGLFVYLEPSAEILAQFTALREHVSQALKIPVLLAWGPRSLDTFGYLFQEEAPRGLHMIVTGDVEADIKTPGATYTFGQMYQAAAIGHFEALSTVGSLALRLHLSSPLVESLTQLQKTMSLALRRLAP